jgi:hypothetical protein
MRTRAQFIVVWCLACTLLFASPLLHAFWIHDGTPVCTATNNQDLPEMASDGAGGAFITWTDVRSGDFDIYAQRVSNRGAPLWTTNGIAVCSEPGVQTISRIVSDGAGGAIINWQDIRDGDRDIYAQRIDADGNIMWEDSGVVVCDTTGHNEQQAMTPDGSGGAIMVWQDRRGAQNEIYAQRINAAGQMLWAHNGVAVTRYDDYEVDPKVIADGSGGAFVVWSDGRSGLDVYAQRINAAGDTLLWTSGGVAICTAAEEQRYPMLVSDGADGAIFAWSDQRGLGDVYIYAQRVDADGVVQWATDGVQICPLTNGQQWPAILSDGAGGAIIAWEEGSSNDNIHAQRIDADGNPLWTANGVDVCTASGVQDRTRIISDGAGGAVIAWEDTRGSSPDIYIQRLSANGVAQWTNDGVAVCTAFFTQEYVKMVTDGSGGAILSWEDTRNGEFDIYGSLIDASGQQVPTLLESYNAAFVDGVVIVKWSVSEPADAGQFVANRKNESGEQVWTTLDVEIEGHDAVYSFTDATGRPGESYRYRVDVTDETGGRTLFKTGAVSTPHAAVTLFQNVPNPFNPRTMIRYYLPRESIVTLTVYDAAGRRVAALVNGDVKPAGYHVAEWDGGTIAGGTLASGVYFYQLRVGKHTTTRKMVLLR